MTDLETRLTYSEDTAARQKLQSGLDEITASQKKLSVEFAKGEISADEYNKQLKELNKQSAVLKKAIAPLNKEFKEQEKLIEKAAREADKLAKEQAKLAQENREVAKSFAQIEDERRTAIDQSGAGAAGNLASLASQGGGAVQTFAGDGVAGQIAGGLTEATVALADTAEAVPQLTGQVLSLFDAAKAGTGVLGGLSSVAQSVVPALGATGGAIAAVTAVALPLVAVVGSVTLAFSLLKKAGEEAAKAEQQAIEARQAQRDTEREFADLIASGDIAAAAEERNQLFRERADLARDIAAEQEELNAINQEIKDSGFGGTIGTGLRARRKEIEENLEGLVGEAAVLGVSLQEADEALAQVSDTELTRANNAELLEQVESQVAQVEAERATTLAQLEAAEQRVAAIDQQRIDLVSNRAQAEADANKLEALESEFARQDDLAEEIEYRENLTKIASEGRDNVVSINQEIANLPAEQLSAITEASNKSSARLEKIETDNRSKLADIDKKFFADNKKLLDGARKAEQKATDDFAKARLRTLQDLNDRLDDAQRGNDVLSFLQAQRDGQKELARQREDADDAAKERTQALIERQNELEARREEAIATQTQRVEEQRQTTLEALEEEKAAITQSFADRKLALEEERQTVIDSTQAAIDAEKQRFAEAEAREQQQADRQSQRDALRDEIDQRRFDEQLAEIEQKKQAELAALHEVEQALAQIEARASDLGRQSNELSTPSRRNSTASRGGNTPFNLVRGALDALTSPGVGERISIPFADGGIVTRPVQGLVGEAGAEAIIPLDRAGDFGFGGNTNNITMPISVNMSVGDIATPGMVQNEVRQGVMQAVEGQMRFLVEALEGR